MPEITAEGGKDILVCNERPLLRDKGGHFLCHKSARLMVCKSANNCGGRRRRDYYSLFFIELSLSSPIFGLFSASPKTLLTILFYGDGNDSKSFLVACRDEEFTKRKSWEKKLDSHGEGCRAEPLTATTVKGARMEGLHRVLQTWNRWDNNKNF